MIWLNGAEAEAEVATGEAVGCREMVEVLYKVDVLCRVVTTVEETSLWLRVYVKVVSIVVVA